MHAGAVYVVNPDGSGARVLANMEEADATWGVASSPDGRQIAFVRDSFLWVMKSDGTRPRRLSDGVVDNPGARSADFAWSPDGREIAFPMAGGLYLVNADGSGLHQLTESGRQAAWSPDGRSIAFTSDRDGNYEIYVMDADGSDQQNLSQSPAQDFGPAWSP